MAERQLETMRLLLCCLTAVGLSALVVGCAATKTSESTGGYIDDAVITTKVKAPIAEDRALSALQIRVETYKGKVQLSGFVDSPAAGDRASKVASQIAGVKLVENAMIVKTPSGTSG